MAVTVKIPTQLRATTGGQADLSAEGATVGEVLEAVFAEHGDLRDRITEDGELRRFVNVYVGGEDIRFGDGLGTAVSDGAEVTILPAVAGGGAGSVPAFCESDIQVKTQFTSHKVEGSSKQRKQLWPLVLNLVN